MEALRKNAAVFVPELSLVATVDGEIVGHALFSKIQIQGCKGALSESLALAPVAVRPEWQRRKIGESLIRIGMEKAQELGFKSAIVLGHETYYPRFGFEPAVEWSIKAPFEVPVRAFMAVELMKGALENSAGTVIYPQEFEMV